ncbi:uncharacterized protein CANTADRAFT_19625 [Suhomyces tanzawaensis NRRL Y-17324]|uniref:Uncharacterized protein n=1 Tax=Suhomyces tanzawaensis NRRL Y-17324 TaxID=984487 RepID=A0A1E4SRK1_9ASCO|nr:uncharacterized protein CANTADRAFT_19625 [Suhomyces tanzawaensis NRRL Y-17324]ODV82032.1 hypothetical protein CANTADRAFT_19625 [Suhomyces tanzawaensis NRRL Y-17324]
MEPDWAEVKRSGEVATRRQVPGGGQPEDGGDLELIVGVDLEARGHGTDRFFFQFLLSHDRAVSFAMTDLVGGRMVNAMGQSPVTQSRHSVARWQFAPNCWQYWPILTTVIYSAYST